MKKEIIEWIVAIIVAIVIVTLVQKFYLLLIQSKERLCIQHLKIEKSDSKSYSKNA